MSGRAEAGLAAGRVGAAVKRVEDPRLLAGQGRYLDDLALPGMLHAAFVRSPYAHARLARVDAGPATRLGGAAVALTGRDVAACLAPILDAPGFASTVWPALARDRVRFAGEAVAALAAASPYVAADAGERIAVEYEPLAPAAASPTRAARPRRWSRAASSPAGRATPSRCGRAPRRPTSCAPRWPVCSVSP